MWFSVMLVLVLVSVLFSPSICLDNISKVYVAEGPSFEKELLIRLTVNSLCINITIARPCNI